MRSNPLMWDANTDNYLIDLTKLSNPTLIICGAHAIMLEKPYYHEFQDRLLKFLAGSV